MDYLSSTPRQVRVRLTSVAAILSLLYFVTHHWRFNTIYSQRMLNLLGKGIYTDYIDELDDSVNVLDVIKSFMPISVIDSLLELVNTKSSQLEELHEKGNIQNEMLKIVRSTYDNTLEILNQSNRIYLSLETITDISNENMVLTKNFFEENSKTIDKIENKEILDAIAETKELIKTSNKASVGKKLASLISIVGSCITIGTAAITISESPYVYELLQALTEFARLHLLNKK